MNFKRRARAENSRAHFRISPSLGALALTSMALIGSQPAEIAFADTRPAASPTGGHAAPASPGTPEDRRIGGRLSDRTSFGRDAIRARGRVSGAGAARIRVSLAVRRPGQRRWRTVAAVRAAGGDKFTIVWRRATPGRYLTKISAVVAGKRVSDRLGAAFVFRRGFASWYGPGFYGNRTACGGRLTATVVGVAHRSLPCGTRVTFHLKGRTVTARVIDRGPFARGRTWDLTPALKRKLRFGSTGVVNATG
ncbi:MAG: septal ring lytic transglycosylase RlpA family protein [Solirubrobacterales bacterium]